MPVRAWTRGDAASDGETRGAAPETTSFDARQKRTSASARTWRRAEGDGGGKRLRAGAAAFEPASRRVEREALEAKMRAVEAEKVKLKAALEAAAREKAEKRDREAAKAAENARRARAAGNLLRGFRDARKNTEEREETLAAPVENLSPEEIERRAVRRVQLAGTDWQVLDLPPGSQKKWVTKSYRDLAKILHPDKCSAPGAKEAFQKLNKAYRALSGVE